MDTLPNEIILVIFDHITKITDKRQFLRTCIKYNIITRLPMYNFESNYKIFCFKKINGYCVEKFTLELCYDSYFDMIPISYVTKNNTILVEALAAFNCIPLLEIAKDNNCDLYSVCFEAAKNGHLNVVKWARQYDCEWDIFTCAFAARNGHLEILKWCIENGCEWDESTRIFAARGGHLNVINWIKEKELKFTWL